MERFKNHYRTLHIDSTADEMAIKAAFRRLALRYHPDRARNARAARRFQEIREAYEVLSSPERRREYDRLYRAQTALRPMTRRVRGSVLGAEARAAAAGLGLTVDVLGLRIGVGLAADVIQPPAPRKPAPRKGPPRRRPPTR